MDLFDDMIAEIKSFQGQKALTKDVRTLDFCEHIHWPEGGNRNLVLESETAVELGHPSDDSVSLALWTEADALVSNHRISLLGPDIAENTRSRLPFGKVVLIGGHGFDEHNAYARYREIDQVRFKVSLKGYMMRAASQYMREWSRVSREAVHRGFSFSILGSALIKGFKKLEYATSVEILFITSSSGDVTRLQPLASKLAKINGAMTKMLEDVSHECNACDYEDTCREVAAIRGMLKAKENKGRRSHAGQQ